MELNERIMQARKQAGLTQEQLGDMLGVSRQAVSKWESGQANPDVAYVAQMCQLFGVSSDWLLLGRSEAVPAGQVCTSCGALLSAGDAFCPKCGTGVKDGQASKERYCLYLASHREFSWAVGQRVAQLFECPWAKPAFPWDDSTIDEHAGFDIIAAAPMVLCRGLTYEEAVQGEKLFDATPGAVRVYREKDMERDEQGEERPVGQPISIHGKPKEPMGPGMAFLMAMLGVIAAIFLMALF